MKSFNVSPSQDGRSVPQGNPFLKGPPPPPAEPPTQPSALQTELIHDYRSLRHRLTHLDEYTRPLSNNTALLLRAKNPADFILRKQNLTRQIRNACFEEMCLVKETVNNLIEEQKKRDERVPPQRNQVVHGKLA